ncbi:MAG: sugar kinase, partial [Mesorhizobium sp.]
MDRREIAAEAAGPTIVAGEILVEIMANERGFGFGEPLALTGPYP